MKKYLSKGLFYQGDAKIITPLLITYIGVFVLNKNVFGGYFDWTIRSNLYNQNTNKYVFTDSGVLVLGLYLVIIYIIAVGIFKRKKWTTLLSGPFSRIDIRKREFVIISMSLVIYIITYLIVIAQGVASNIEIIRYMGNFHEIILIDLIRIISISTIVIGGMALLDSIFSNIYYLVGSCVFIIIYAILLLGNFSSSFYMYIYDENRGVRYLENGLSEYIQGIQIGDEMSNLQIAVISAIFIITGIVLIIISKKLTNKMLVENMNEGILFTFPKKVAKFMIITFCGITIAPFLSNLINETYFYYTLVEKDLILIRLAIIIVTSIISWIIFRRVKKLENLRF